MNVELLIEEISFDIETGKFDKNEQIKERLKHIKKKLVFMKYVINAGNKITKGERRFLIEQGYELFV